MSEPKGAVKAETKAECQEIKETKEAAGDETADPDVDADDETVDVKKEQPKKTPVSGAAFKAYGSLIQADSGSAIKKLHASGFTDKKHEWVATEKVHGANFSFSVARKSTGDDGKAESKAASKSVVEPADDELVIHCYKRTGAVRDDEDFFQWKQLRETYRERLCKLFRLIAKQRAGSTSGGSGGGARVEHVDNVTVFGELFGGAYPHKDVAPVAGMKHVQKFLYYLPTYEFFAFDISVNRRGYMDYDPMVALFKEAGFFYSQPLARGTFEKLFAFDVETFETTIPGLFNLPAIKDNRAEGIVLRTVTTQYMPGGDRIVFKKKREGFSEIGRKPDAKPKPKKAAKDKADLSAPSVPDAVKDLVDDLQRYVTANRLRNVLSKIGKVTRGDSNRLVGLLAKDALDDHRKEGDAFDKLEPALRKVVSAQLSMAASALVRENLDAIVEGDF